MPDEVVKKQAGEIERKLISGDVKAAEQLFRDDYLAALKNRKPEQIEQLKAELQKDPIGYKLVMLEVAKDMKMVGPSSNNDVSFKNDLLTGRLPDATPEDKLKSDAAKEMLNNYTELTGGGKHYAVKTLGGHWGEGVVSYDVERVQRELRQELAARGLADKLSANDNHLFQKLSTNGETIWPMDLKNALDKDDKLGHKHLTADERSTVEQLIAANNKTFNSALPWRTPYWDLSNGYSNITLDKVKAHASSGSTAELMKTVPSPVETSKTAPAEVTKAAPKVESTTSPANRTGGPATETAAITDGYWQIAKRVLERNVPKGGHAPSNEEINTEYLRLRKLNQDKPIHAGDIIKIKESESSNPNNSDKAKSEKVAELEVKKGDSYTSIAKRTLGPEATNVAIQAKAHELQIKNHYAKLIWDEQRPRKILA